MDLKMYFMLFITYSIIGWILEIIVVSIQQKKLTTARGFLIGPYCPIYGTGAILITLLLSKYHSDIIVLFFMSCILGASLEYFTSYIMEKLFKTRWWDYSVNKYNINGRICLTTTVFFGLLGVILIEFLNPTFINLINAINPVISTIIAIILLIIFITDIIVSFNIISGIKRIELSDAKDTTEEVTKKVKETLKNRSLLYKRLINAYPNLKIKVKRDLKKYKKNSKNV